MEDDNAGIHAFHDLIADYPVNCLQSHRSQTPKGRRMSQGEEQMKRPKMRSRGSGEIKKATALLSILLATPSTMAQGCVSLSGSTTCPAFGSASVSTTSSVTLGLFPFLQFVSDTASFDQQMMTYTTTTYVKQKYQDILGCDNIVLTNVSDLYARFTNTVICNSIVQNSKDACDLSDAQAKPVCAETCAEQAESEAQIVANSALCSNPAANRNDQIRADFTNCALPANSLSGNCINGADNEPTNCGFGNSTLGLCGYCASGGTNSTDTCCYNSKAEDRCQGVVLPSITASIVLQTSTVTATPSATTAPAAAGSKKSGLSGGAIAGIAIGAVVGAALLIGLIVLLLICLRRRRGSQAGSVFNQPSPPRKSQGMAYNPVGTQAPAGYEVLPGGRIARMSALEGHSSNSPPRGSPSAGAAAVGAAAGYAAGRGRRGHHDISSSDEFRESPESDVRGGVLRPPPTSRRNGSLSSNSALGDEQNSPHSGSGGDLSSPQGMTSQQSEQLPFFKDYYSQDEIHPGDKVATLWAYQPRAGDEFLLERGDMLKVVGIWDDGWATGVMIDERAEDWDAKRNAQRDSGVSNGSGRRESSPPASGEIKAFPLVCVCLPEHWKKTIDGDGSTETGSTGGAPNVAARDPADRI